MALRLDDILGSFALYFSRWLRLGDFADKRRQAVRLLAERDIGLRYKARTLDVGRTTILDEP